MGVIVDIDDMLEELGLGSPSTAERNIVTRAVTRAEGAVKRYLKYDPVQATRTEFYPQLDMNLPGRQAIWEVSDNEAFIRRLSEGVTSELQVRHIPIRSISSLLVDYDARAGTRSGSFAAETAWSEGTDFFPNYDTLDSSNASMCSDGIIRSEGRWPDIPGSVKVTYIAGYTASEFQGTDSKIDASPIWDAVLSEVAARVNRTYSRMKQGGSFGGGALVEEDFGDYRYKRDSAILMQLVGTSWDLLPETQQKLSDFVNYGILAM